MNRLLTALLLATSVATAEETKVTPNGSRPSTPPEGQYYLVVPNASVNTDSIYFGHQNQDMIHLKAVIDAKVTNLYMEEDVAREIVAQLRKSGHMCKWYGHEWKTMMVREMPAVTNWIPKEERECEVCGLRQKRTEQWEDVKEASRE